MTARVTDGDTETIKKLTVELAPGTESGDYVMTVTGYTPDASKGEKIVYLPSEWDEEMTVDSAFDAIVARLADPEAVEAIVSPRGHFDWDGESEVSISSGAVSVFVITEDPAAIKAFGVCPILG